MNTPWSYRKRSWLLVAPILLALGFLAVEEAGAVPSFARKYETSCSTCHYAFPKLNAFGKAFNNNGFRYPEGQDPEMTKEDPVSLGSEAYRRVWPDAIWPTDIAGTSPVSFHAIGRFLYFEGDQMTTFEIPHELEVLFAGTFDDRLSYFGEVELEHESELAYEFMLQYDASPGAHIRLGSVGLRATPEHYRLTKEHYNVEDLKNQSGTWRLRDGAGGGAELWGALNGAQGKGGATYSVGIGNGQNDADNFDLNKRKDVFARATYKIGGLGETGGTGSEGSEESAFYVDNSVRAGAFVHSGVAVDDDGEEDEFAVYGGDIDLWYDRLIVTAAGMAMRSDYMGKERDSFAAFGEGNFVFYPWLIGYARYEYTDKDVDDDKDAVTTAIPAVVAMVRANVKCSAEYKIPLDSASKDTGGFTFQFNFAF